ARMVDGARKRLHEAGYAPYYLYRQKYMAGNLENVGYARPGYACLYNIDNMEETTRILAEGAGAITKWLFPRERRIERAPNVRNIEQYIGRVDEMAARKRTLILGKEDNEHE
ncbi:MAG: coproporphyrinogen dehydrogenase HemZ, partial [Clostridia bacterium]|nr:coproporphyrinogen dehydrogenase HemZ [Clostridia bacterium]